MRVINFPRYFPQNVFLNNKRHIFKVKNKLHYDSTRSKIRHST